MRITSKGQVTIPQAVREQTGMLPNTEVDFVVEGDAVRIVRVAAGKRPSRGTRAVRALRAGRRNMRLPHDDGSGLRG